MLCVWIDELTPCLKNAETGEIMDTEVIRLRRKSFLSKYNEKTGWYVDWSDLLEEHEIYALVLKGSVDIQGLVALSGSEDYEGVYVAWMCTAPQNNKAFMETPKYLGVGGHLFAIAAQRSDELGYDGYITGFAANMELVNHYKEAFDAEHIGMLHPFQIIIGEEAAHNIREVYNYEWTDDEL